MKQQNYLGQQGNVYGNSVLSAIATTMQVQYELLQMFALVALRQGEKEKREHTCEQQNDHITI